MGGGRIEREKRRFECASVCSEWVGGRDVYLHGTEEESGAALKEPRELKGANDTRDFDGIEGSSAARVH